MRSCLLTIALVCSCASSPAGNQTHAPNTAPAPAQQPAATAQQPTAPAQQPTAAVQQPTTASSASPPAGTQQPAAPSKHESAQVACAQREEAVRSRGRFFSKITVDKDYSGEWVLSRNRQVTAFLDIQDSRHPRSRAAEGGDAEAIHVLVVPNQPREHIAQTLGDPITQADLKAASAVFREAHALARRLGIREPNIYANSESRIGVGYLHVHIEGRLPAGKKLPRLSK